MSNSNSFIKAAFLADDVRTEINGKHIIIGAYGSEIGVSKFPVSLQFKLLFILEFGDEKKRDLNIRLVGPSGDVFAKFEAEVEIDKPNSIQIMPTIGFSIPFSSEGQFQIEALRDKHWEIIGIWRIVRVSENAGPLVVK